MYDLLGFDSSLYRMVRFSRRSSSEGDNRLEPVLALESDIEVLENGYARFTVQILMAFRLVFVPHILLVAVPLRVVLPPA